MESPTTARPPEAPADARPAPPALRPHPAVWASDVTFEIAAEPPPRETSPPGSQRYFTIAVAIVTMVGAIIGILAS